MRAGGPVPSACMARPRPASVAVAALVASVLAGAGAAPAQADRLLGKSTNRHGTVTVRFSTDPGWVVIEMNRKMRRGSKGRLLELQCHDGRRYITVLGVRWTETSTFGGPAALPDGSSRCRIRRSGTVVATMRMRLQSAG